MKFSWRQAQNLANAVRIKKLPVHEACHQKMTDVGIIWDDWMTSSEIIPVPHGSRKRRAIFQSPKHYPKMLKNLVFLLVQLCFLLSQFPV